MTTSHPFEDLRLHEVDWVALDLEATGVAWGHDRIVEIGALHFRLDAEGRVTPGPRFHSLIDPGQPIPEIVTRLTGLSDAEVRGAPRLSEVWRDFETFIAGRIVIAHGARSDLSWLGAEALRLAVAPLAASFICTLDTTRRLVPDAPRQTLTALTEHLGLAHEASEFHRALADALHTRNVFARCVRSSGARTLRDLGYRAPLSWPAPESYHVALPARLAGLDELAMSQTRCLISYRGGSAGRDLRPVTPLGLFAMDGVTYLRAWCHLSDTAKSFRCDRIAAWRSNTDGVSP